MPCLCAEQRHAHHARRSDGEVQFGRSPRVSFTVAAGAAGTHHRTTGSDVLTPSDACSSCSGTSS
jgi:hypothetical protein